MEQQIKSIMASIFEIPVESITDGFDQHDAAQWDSLNHLNLVIDLESFFNISFEPDEMSNMDSLDKIIHYCKMKTATV